MIMRFENRSDLETDLIMLSMKKALGYPPPEKSFSKPVHSRVIFLFKSPKNENNENLRVLT